MIRFANTLGQTLRTARHPLLIEMVARSLGHMARHTAVSQADYVERELDRALEWLRSTNPHRMLAACAILREFASCAPTGIPPLPRTKVGYMLFNLDQLFFNCPHQT